MLVFDPCEGWCLENSSYGCCAIRKKLKCTVSGSGLNYQGKLSLLLFIFFW